MRAHYDSLKALHTQADDLYALGKKAGMEYAAINEYAALKAELQNLLKQSERAWKGNKPWFVGSYQYALRNAHIALKCPTQTSPKNPKWAPCVSSARFELNDVISKFEKAIQSGLEE